MSRLALYFVPGEATALARFGNEVLGRDALGAPVAAPPDLPPAPSGTTAGPARYGFHATLKAPFSLAPGADEAAVRALCGQIAARHAPIPLPTLAPRRLDAFIALTLAHPIDALDALEADCVRTLEPARAPLDAAALARRRPERLAPDARERLERWGYPHVLEGFRFHMTLSGPLGSDAAFEATVMAWLEALGDRFERRVGASAVLDRLALCREAVPGAPFVRVAEYPLDRMAIGR